MDLAASAAVAKRTARLAWSYAGHTVIHQIRHARRAKEKARSGHFKIATWGSTSHIFESYFWFNSCGKLNPTGALIAACDDQELRLLHAMTRSSDCCMHAMTRSSDCRMHAMTRSSDCRMHAMTAAIRPS